MRSFIIPISVICLLFIAGCKEKAKTTSTPDSTPQNGEQLQEAPSSQSEIKIIPIEHATAVLEWEDITIYIDPVGGAEVFKNQKRPDLIIITDVHGDHLSVETLEGLNTANTKILVPQAVADEI
ncbi:MAG: MBL fold metallo-hydrolase, partial [Flavobacteriaceae bacterium]